MDRPYRQARVLLLERRFEPARAAFAARVAERPLSYSARLGEALCLFELGRVDEARGAFAELTLDLDAGALSLAYEHLGEDEVDLDDWVAELVRLGDTRRALELSRLLPPRWHGHRAWCLHELGRSAQALALVRRGRVGGELAAEILMATGFTDEAGEVFAAQSRGPRTSWYHRGGDERKAAGVVGRARVAYRRGELTHAVRHAGRALALDGRSARALLVEAAALADLGLDERARRALGRLARAHPLEHHTVDEIAQSDLEQRLGVSTKRRDALDAADADFAARRFTEAAAGYARALRRGTKKLAPRPLAASTRWAYALAASGDAARAADVACWVAAVDPDNLTAGEIQCWALAQLGDNEPAAAGEGSTHEVSRRLFERCGLGVRLEAEGLHGEAVSWDDYVAEPAERALRHARASCVERATRLTHHGHWRAALAVFAGCELEPGAEARFVAAHAASNIADHALCWEVLEPLLAARRDVSYYAQPLDPWLLALDALLAIEQPDRALEVFGRLRQIWYSQDDERRAPLLARARRAAARAHELLGQVEEAAALRAEAEHVAPGPDDAARARALHARGFAREAAAATDAALADYARALDLDPGAADVAGNAANVLTHAGQIARAYPFFNHGRLCFGDLRPALRRGWFLSKLAWCAYRAQAYLAGAALGRRAAALTGNAGEWHTVALCEQHAGRDDAAREALGRALACDPRLPQLHALVAALGWPPSWSGLPSCA